MAKMSKAERKAAKQAKKNEQVEEMVIVERDLGYDADYFVDNHGTEIEFVRPDFIVKPEWYYDMFHSKKIHYRSNELQALCSDGKWHTGKDVKSGLAMMPDGAVALIEDSELNEKWRHIATSTSRMYSPSKLH